ncbi:MAG: polyprenyl synthetase family protein [Flavobacteriales bacterium]|nr:polyprenyl synthetase family protein [Flavobacteriales bacterium]
MEQLRKLIEERIEQWCDALPQSDLYAPMAYLMRLPGKRIRPAAVLMGADLFGADPRSVLDEALGIELFHNFTLMHDDIMDAAPLRRGKATVHVKWNTNTAILSGDAMLVKAYQLMGRDARVAQLFSRYALEVCEGQELDMAFEQRATVSLAEYTEMIRLKTAVLLSCALQVGAQCANAPAEDMERLGSVGEHLGLAFQLRDDLLDAFGDPQLVGKQQGGDLRAGKKTWLLIRGLELEATQGSTLLRDQLARPAESRDVPLMIGTLEALGVRTEAEAEVARHDALALAALDHLAVPEERKAPLRQLAAQLMVRVY